MPLTDTKVPSDFPRRYGGGGEKRRNVCLILSLSLDSNSSISEEDEEEEEEVWAGDKKQVWRVEERRGSLNELPAPDGDAADEEQLSRYYCTPGGRWGSVQSSSDKRRRCREEARHFLIRTQVRFTCW